MSLISLTKQSKLWQFKEIEVLGNHSTLSDRCQYWLYTHNSVRQIQPNFITFLPLAREVQRYPGSQTLFVLQFWKRWIHLCLCGKESFSHVCQLMQSLQRKIKFCQTLQFANQIVCKPNHSQTKVRLEPWLQLEILETINSIGLVWTEKFNFKDRS